MRENSQWLNPEFRASQQTFEARQKRAKGLILYSRLPETRQKNARLMSEKSKQWWQDPEYRTRKLKWAYELTTILWADPEFREVQRRAVEKMWQNPELKAEIGSKISQRMKNQWENSQYRNEQIQRLVFVGHHFGKPTKIEQIFINWINEAKLPLRYVGDGSLIIGGKNPDFLNIDGKKQIIELYGSYWHKGENPENRVKHFRDYGFDCLVIWEHELKKKDAVLGKVKEFLLKREVAKEA